MFIHCCSRMAERGFWKTSGRLSLGSLSWHLPKTVPRALLRALGLFHWWRTLSAGDACRPLGLVHLAPRIWLSSHLSTWFLLGVPPLLSLLLPALHTLVSSSCLTRRLASCIPQLCLESYQSPGEFCFGGLILLSLWALKYLATRILPHKWSCFKNR